MAHNIYYCTDDTNTKLYFSNTNHGSMTELTSTVAQAIASLPSTVETIEIHPSSSYFYTYNATYPVNFLDCNTIKYMNFAHWYFDNYTLEHFFESCTQLISANFTDATLLQGGSSAAYMFANCTRLQTVDGLGTFLSTHSGQLQTLEYMFYNCKCITESMPNELSVPNWFFEPESIEGIFYYAEPLSSSMVLDLSNFLTKYDSSSVRVSCKGAFQNSGFTSIKFGCVLDKISSMESMFSGCSQLEDAIIVGIEGSHTLSNLTSMKNMFKNCTSLKYLTDPKCQEISIRVNSSDETAFKLGIPDEDTTQTQVYNSIYISEIASSLLYSYTGTIQKYIVNVWYNNGGTWTKVNKLWKKGSTDWQGSSTIKYYHDDEWLSNT